MSVSHRQKMIVSRAPKGSSRELAGSVQTFLLTALAVLFIAGGGYLYSVNQNAVQGYQMRSLEKEIDTLKQKNAELRITEADLRSLDRIEGSQEQLDMQKLENVKYIEERGSAPLASAKSVGPGGPVALR